MPRATRSRQLANDILEDETVADEVHTESLTEDLQGRSPLSVIDPNTEEVPVPEVLMDTSKESTKSKGEKAKGGKKAAHKATADMTVPIVAEQETGGVENTALNELIKDQTQALENSAESLLPPPAEATDEAPSDESSGSSNEQCPAGQPKGLVSPMDQQSSRRSIISTEGFPDYKEPSEQEEGSKTEESREDSFTEHITARSPAKSLQRPEDSFEAMDDLEDAIEQVDKALTPVSTPVAANTTATKTKGAQKATPKKTVPGVKSIAPIKQQKPVMGAKPASKLAVKSRVTAAGPSVTIARVSGNTPKKTAPKAAAGPKAQTQGTEDKETKEKDASAVPHSTVGQHRVSMTFPPPPGPAKSSKTPTRPTFELPGEAISRRLKEQREERQKREQEDQLKKREFKAKPVRKPAAPSLTVRPTATSRARLARASLDPGAADAAEDKSKSAGAGTIRPIRPSSIQIPKRTQRPLDTAATTHTGVRKPSLPTTSRKLSVTTGGTQPSTVTAADTVHQRQRGKQIFGRDRIEQTEREQARKAKEDAARRAREEASERGRVASREWAEKQKRRKKEKAAVAATAASTVATATTTVIAASG